MASEIQYGDFDSDGTHDIMLKQNVAGGLGKIAKKVMFYKSGSLSRLSWNVAIFEEQWRTKEISGYIADFIISDLDGDGTNEVTMLIVENRWQAISLITIRCTAICSRIRSIRAFCASLLARI